MSAYFLWAFVNDFVSLIFFLHRCVFEKPKKKNTNQGVYRTGNFCLLIYLPDGCHYIV